MISGDAIGMVHFREKDLKRKAAHRVWVYTGHTYCTVHFGCLVEVRFAVFYTVNLSHLYCHSSEIKKKYGAKLFKWYAINKLLLCFLI